MRIIHGRSKPLCLCGHADTSGRGQTKVSSSEFKVPGSNSKPETRNLKLESKAQGVRGLMAYVSLSLVLVLLLGNSSPAHALERIRIGLSVRNVVFLPFYYAQEKKIFEKYGLAVRSISLR